MISKINILNILSKEEKIYEFKEKYNQFMKLLNMLYLNKDNEFIVIYPYIKQDGKNDYITLSLSYDNENGKINVLMENEKFSFTSSEDLLNSFKFFDGRKIEDVLDILEFDE